MTCPDCHSDDVRFRGKPYALYPMGIIAIVGLPFAVLHYASTPNDYHCSQCGGDFSKRTVFACFAYVVWFLFVAGVIVLLTIVSFAYCWYVALGPNWSE